MAKKYLLINNMVVSAALYELFAKTRKTQQDLGTALNISSSYAGHYLSGRTQITVNRLLAICRASSCSEQDVYDIRDAMIQMVAKELGEVHLLSAFPLSLKKNETIIRTMPLNLRRDGHPWETLLNPEGFGSDELIRARGAKGWSLDRTADAFGVCANTVANWEHYSMPVRHEELAKKVFADVLKGKPELKIVPHRPAASLAS